MQFYGREPWQHRHLVLERAPFPWRGLLTIIVFLATAFAVFAFGDFLFAVLETGFRVAFCLIFC